MQMLISTSLQLTWEEGISFTSREEVRLGQDPQHTIYGLYSPWNSLGQNRSPGDLPNPEVEPRSPELQVDSLPADPQGEPLLLIMGYKYAYLRVHAGFYIRKGLSAQ